jgi:hypothetical protein
MQKWVRFGIIVCIGTTALIHLALAIPAHLIGFYVNSLGFFGSLWCYVAPPRRIAREHIVFALRLWTTITLVLWLIIGDRSLIAFTDKVVELGLLGLLWLEERVGAR